MPRDKIRVYRENGLFAGATLVTNDVGEGEITLPITGIVFETSYEDSEGSLGFTVDGKNVEIREINSE